MDDAVILVFGRRFAGSEVYMNRFVSIPSLLALVLAVSDPVTAAEPSAANNPAPPASGVFSLGAAHAGVVDVVLVKDGAHVEPGQLLLRLDCRPLEKEIDFRAASLAAAEAALTRVRNGARPEEIAIAEAGVGVATARAEEARDALDRANELQVGVSITRADLFVVQRDSRIAEAQLVDAQKKLALVEAGSRAEDIAEAQARRDAADAFLDEGKAELDQCSVRAPAAGTVQVFARPGQFVSVLAQAPLVLLTADAGAK